VTVNLAETSVVKSRPSVLHEVNLFVILSYHQVCQYNPKCLAGENCLWIDVSWCRVGHYILAQSRLAECMLHSSLEKNFSSIWFTPVNWFFELKFRFFENESIRQIVLNHESFSTSKVQ